MKPLLRLLTLAVSGLAFLALAPTARADRPFFSPPPLSAFDGQKWGSLVIGQTTFKHIRPLYETGEGLMDSSTELSQPKNAPLRVDLLWRKQNGQEVLGAIAIGFKENSAGQSDLLKAFTGADAGKNEAGDETLPPGVEALYQAGRFEQWRVLRFPNRGVAAFQIKIGDVTQTPLLLFAGKDGVGTLSQSLSSEYSSPVERVDPNADKPKIAEIGRVYASISLDSDFDISRRTRENWEDRLSDRMRASGGDGTLRYRRGEGGTFNLSVTTTRSKNGGSASATAKIEGDGPYGPISASGTGYDSWRRDRDKSERGQLEDALFDASESAMQNAEREFAKKIRASGPPPLDVVRWNEWLRLVDTVRDTGTLAPIVF